MSQYKVGNLVVSNTGDSGLLTEHEEHGICNNRSYFKLEWTDGRSDLINTDMIDLFVRYGKWTVER
jgi:hypothetical protein